MATPNQTASARPISFILHNTDDGSAPHEHKLVVRPEDLTRNDTSRLAVHQTLGGAWADNFGKGLPTVQISGVTGWGQGSLPNGQAEFEMLHNLVYVSWHALRENLVKLGKSPDKIKLIFHDQLDDFTWVVAPTQFVLKRSKSRPLLSQYSINMTYLSDDVSETLSALDKLKIKTGDPALESLSATLSGIVKFANQMSSDITRFFGPLKEGVIALVNVTAVVLTAVKTAIAAGMHVVDAVTGNLMDIGAGLSIAASNVFATITSVQAIPGRIMARLMRVKSLFLNVFCVLTNAYKRRIALPNYDDIYGASLCSSTAGGRPLSKYLDTNTMENITPIIKNNLAVTSDSVAAMTQLKNADIVFSPLSLASVGSLAERAANGTVIMAA